MALIEMRGRLRLIWNLVMAIMRAAGMIVLCWGVFELAKSYQAHDPSDRRQALKKVISGILLILAEAVFQMLGGIRT